MCPSQRDPSARGGAGPPPAVRDGRDHDPDADYWPQETLSDLARIRRDHEFLRVLATAVAKQGLGNPITDINLINSVKADLTFDQSWSVTDMANLVLDFHSVNINAVPQLTLPVAVVTDPDGAGGEPHVPGRRATATSSFRRRARTRAPSTSCSASAPTLTR